MPDVETLLATREVTHGPFSSNAVAFDRLLNACPLEGFDPRARYAIAGIYFKLARLYSGKLVREHVEDIEGYAAKLLELIDTAEKR